MKTRTRTRTIDCSDNINDKNTSPGTVRGGQTSLHFIKAAGISGWQVCSQISHISNHSAKPLERRNNLGLPATMSTYIRMGMKVSWRDIRTGKTPPEL